MLTDAERASEGMMAEQEAGPALDAEIAERIMGWQWVQNPPGPSSHPYHRWLIPSALWAEMPDGFVVADMARPIYHNPRILPYSTEIAAAWLVMDWLRARWDHVFLHCRNGDEWQCGGYDVDRYVQTWARGSAPLAICRVVLATLEPIP